jgi:hypothetical protein
MSDTAMPLRHNSRVRLPSVLRLIRRAHSGHLRSIAEKMTLQKASGSPNYVVTLISLPLISLPLALRPPDT